MRNLARLHGQLILVTGGKSYNNIFRIPNGNYRRRTGLLESEEEIREAFDQMVSSFYVSVQDLSKSHRCERLYSLTPKGREAYKKLHKDEERLAQ